MSYSEFLSVIAIIISIIAIVKSSIASKIANDLSKGQGEIQIRELISSSRRHFADIATHLPAKKSIIKKLMASAHEDILNAYDEACAKYIDGKIDKKRFKKMYKDEIKNIVEAEETSDNYIEPQSKYQATLKVYNEWNNLEK